MKNLILILFIFTSMAITGCVVTSGTVSSTTYVRHADPTFSELNGYGTWVDIPDYGTVWKPYDEANWQPYADGQWVWTDQGWMWDSNEPYGWIVYHYGYWQYTDYDGWFWIPGYDWAPARVNWYRTNGYVGWAPAPPPNVSTTVIYNQVYVTRVWVVVPENNFVGYNASRYRDRDYVPGAQVLRSGGGRRAPDVRDIENVSHRRIDPVQPTREQVNAGNHQLTRVRVQNNAPVSPSTIRNQPDPVRVPPTNSNGENRPRPERTPPANPPVVNPPAGNPQPPASRPPEINDRRPVNNGVPRQPAERGNQAAPPDNSRIDPRDKAHGNPGTNNPPQNNTGRNSGRREGVRKPPVPNPSGTHAPVNVHPPARDSNAVPAKQRDKNNKDDRDQKKVNPEQQK